MDEMKTIAGLEEHRDVTDVTLISGIDKQKVSARRLVLMARSTYFAALLDPSFREDTQEEIPIEKINGPTLRAIKDYIYYGSIEITDQNVHDIVAAASLMQLDELVTKCGKFWRANLTIENCVEIFLSADRYCLQDLRRVALQYVCQHFDAVPIEDIQHINAENLQELLSDNQIRASQTMIFDRLAQWMQQHGIKPSVVASDMLKTIRLDGIPNAFLIGTIHPFFDEYDCGKWVINEYQKRLLNSEPQPLQPTDFISIYCHLSNSLVHFLVDSQAYISVVKLSALTKGYYYNISENILIKGVANSFVSTLGTVMIALFVDNETIVHKFHLVDDKTAIPANGIIGKDFLKLYRCCLDYDSMSLTIRTPQRDLKVHIQSELVENIINIPAWSEHTN